MGVVAVDLAEGCNRTEALVSGLCFIKPRKSAARECHPVTFRLYRRPLENGRLDESILLLSAIVILSLVFSECGGGGSSVSRSNGEWTWANGPNVGNQSGTYGSLGMAASSNVPGSRDSAVGWVDASGNFWLFGGAGYASNGDCCFLNDLWRYSAGQWAWMSGSNAADQPGTYGTLGTTHKDPKAVSREA